MPRIKIKVPKKTTKVIIKRKAKVKKKYKLKKWDMLASN